ncbi:MAG: hypothetical protein O7D91_21585 [Planctomycetota bacterium]|nr:hypothetical protein [Planctomycetota bacterium]
MIVSVRSLSANIADRQDEDSDRIFSPDAIRYRWSEQLLRQADLFGEYNEITNGRTADDSLADLEQAVIDEYGASVWDNEAYSQALLATDTYHNFAVCNITATPNSQADANNQSDRNPNGDIVRYRPNKVDWRNDIDLDGIDRRGIPKTYTEADLLDPDTFVDLCVRVTGVGGSVNNKAIVMQKNGPPT